MQPIANDVFTFRANQKALVTKIERRLETAQANYEKHVQERLHEIKLDV